MRRKLDTAFFQGLLWVITEVVLGRTAVWLDLLEKSYSENCLLIVTGFLKLSVIICEYCLIKILYIVSISSYITQSEVCPLYSTFQKAEILQYDHRSLVSWGQNCWSLNSNPFLLLCPLSILHVRTHFLKNKILPALLINWRHFIFFILRQTIFFVSKNLPQ